MLCGTEKERGSDIGYVSYLDRSRRIKDASVLREKDK